MYTYKHEFLSSRYLLQNYAADATSVVCSCSYWCCVQLLLHFGGDPLARTVDGWTPLHCASKWANVECVRPLVRAEGVDINAPSNSGQTPLHLAATNPEAQRTLKYLLRQPALQKDLTNSLGDTAKDIASRSGPFAHLFVTVVQKSLNTEKAHEQGELSLLKDGDSHKNSTYPLPHSENVIVDKSAKS